MLITLQGTLAMLLNLAYQFELVLLLLYNQQSLFYFSVVNFFNLILWRET